MAELAPTAGPGRPARPTPAALAAAGQLTIPDVAAPGLRVLFSGINPGLYSAATGYHFARPGNRFWPALHQSGFTPRQFRPDEQEQLLGLGLGITNIVDRATARADELTAQELRDGGAALASSAYRTAFGRPEAGVGSQELTAGDTRLWVLPNPSGLNAHWPLPKLIEAFRDLRLHAEG